MVESSPHLFRRHQANAVLTPDESRAIEEMSKRRPRDSFEGALPEFSRGVPMSRKELDFYKGEAESASRAPSGSGRAANKSFRSRCIWQRVQ